MAPQPGRRRVLCAPHQPLRQSRVFVGYQHGPRRRGEEVPQRCGPLYAPSIIPVLCCLANVVEEESPFRTQYGVMEIAGPRVIGFRHSRESCWLADDFYDLVCECPRLSNKCTEPRGQGPPPSPAAFLPSSKEREIEGPGQNAPVLDRLR